MSAYAVAGWACIALAVIVPAVILAWAILTDPEPEPAPGAVWTADNSVNRRQSRYGDDFDTARDALDDVLDGRAK